MGKNSDQLVYSEIEVTESTSHNVVMTATADDNPDLSVTYTFHLQINCRCLNFAPVDTSRIEVEFGKEA